MRRPEPSFHRLALITVLASSTLVWNAACSSNDSGSDGSGGTGEGSNGPGGSQGSGSSSSFAGFTGVGDGDGDGQLGDGDGQLGDGDGQLGDGDTGDSVTVGASCDCGGVACQCSDGLDNDGDSPDGIQNIDGLDIECTGACDNDEGSFATGIPGDNQDPHQDCFFDGDSGAGNDGCKDSNEPSLECQNFCAPLTPNGCDCFGCCTVTLSDGGTTTVQLGGTCSDADLIEDTSACEPCTQSETCVNECGECELCPGKVLADIPESCGSDNGDGDGDGDGDGSGGSPNFSCDNGATPCTSSAECGGNGYCQTGCCVDIVLR